MNRKARVYITVVSIIGVAMAIVSTRQFILGLAGIPFSEYGWNLLLLIGLCAACRSFPIIMKNDQQLDVSVIAVLAAFLLHGMNAAVFVYLSSSLITFEKDGNKIRCIYNTNLSKTLFNLSDIVIAIVIPGLICRLLPWQPGVFHFPMVLLPTLIFSAFAFVFNYLGLLLLFWLNGDIMPHEMGKELAGLTFNVLAAMPLGLMISLLLSLPNGTWLTLLMICPLLLARYAWKLYLDATRHKEKLLSAFVSSMEARDPYTQGHSQRVGEYAKSIAQQLRCSPQQIDYIREGALLHDIGKIGVSDLILHKPGRLTHEERVIMERHPAIGVDIVGQVGLSDTVLEMIRSHHERYDGKGYPDGRFAAELRLSTRILA
ncbi:MAG: HD domain-containing protein, partial [Eubacteriales bacterium]|nr:HD domain-containing protein [Eubacteriales bacterium]